MSQNKELQSTIYPLRHIVIAKQTLGPAKARVVLMHPDPVLLLVACRLMR